MAKLSVWALNVALFISVAGFAGYMGILWLPALQFVPSPAWYNLISPVQPGWYAVPVAFAFWIALFASRSGVAAFEQSLWPRMIRRKRHRGKVPLHLATLLLGPILLGFGYGFFTALVAPIPIVLITSGNVTHEYTVDWKAHSGSNRRTIYFGNSSFFEGAIKHPPDDVFQLAEEGDTLLLTGVGSRWGVFWSDVELIKQE